MAIPSRQIGWGTEDNLLWQISKQLERLTCVTAGGCGSITTTTTSSTTAAPVYKVYTALLTQSGGDNPDGDSNFPLVIGRTYQIGNPIPEYILGDFTNVGAPNNDIGTYFIATGAIPNSWGENISLSFNTGAPVATVLENTIGNIWFTYDDVGSYLASGDFPINKTYAVISNMGQIPGDNILITSYILQDALYVTTSSLASSGASVYSDNILLTTPIEIRVYN